MASSIVLAVALSACGSEAPRLADPADVSGRSRALPAAEANAKAPKEEALTAGLVGSPTTQMDALVHDVAEVASAAADVPPASDREVRAAMSDPTPTEAPNGSVATAERGTPSIVTPLPELCREACANAQRLVLAELPVETAKAMREEVQRSLERECPGRCMQRASLDSARCIASAKSALELATCQ